MTSTFSFGFAGDDIDIDDTEMNETHETHSDQNAGAGSTLPELIPAKKHDVAEWVSNSIYGTLLVSITQIYPSHLPYPTLLLHSSINN